MQGMAVDGSVLIYPCLDVVPMGWSWALHYVQLIHEGIALEALQVSGGTMARDVQSVPLPDAGCVVSLYVDNIIVHGDLG